MAASGSRVFIHGVTADGSSRMNSEAYTAILSAQIRPNVAKLTRWRYTVWMNDDLKHTAKAAYSSVAE